MPQKIPPQIKRYLDNLFGFFNEHALDPHTGVYYSDLDNHGLVLSDKVYTVALSRHIYALAYTSAYYPEHLQKAQTMATFLLNNLVNWHPDDSYFKSFTSKNAPDTGTDLDIWQQSYGLCGLTELYRQTGNQELLAQIHTLHKALVKRFRDAECGGFWGNYNLSAGAKANSKTLQSLMYPITAYMANLWEADTANRDLYEPVLQEHLRLMYQNAWNSHCGWVNLKFDAEWHPVKNINPEKPEFCLMPGHNFQMAALLIRASKWPFFESAIRLQFEQLAHNILQATLRYNITNGQPLNLGFFSEINPITGKITDNRKTWWQHCEAIIALSLAGETFKQELLAITNFFTNTFADYQFGGEYFYVDANNIPIESENKGNMGKATYHTTEMVRFLMETSH